MTGVTAAPPRRSWARRDYMAPEQVEHPKDVDHRADIYSLGVVFYQMLTGELPLGRFEPPSHKVLIDVRLDEVVLKALEQEPDRRYQQASQVKTEVETMGGLLTSLLDVVPAKGEAATLLRAEAHRAGGRRAPRAGIAGGGAEVNPKPEGRTKLE